MRRFTGYVQTDKVGSRCEFEFETEDDATDLEIAAAVREAVFERVEWTYDEVK